MIATVLLTLVSAVVTFYMDSIAGAWKLLIVTGAGTGSVLLLRWYWWRINAWSEVSAMISAFIVSVRCKRGRAFRHRRSNSRTTVGLTLSIGSPVAL
jgi:Na+/proline symporter